MDSSSDETRAATSYWKTLSDTTLWLEDARRRICIHKAALHQARIVAALMTRRCSNHCLALHLIDAFILWRCRVSALTSMQLITLFSPSTSLIYNKYLTLLKCGILDIIALFIVKNPLKAGTCNSFFTLIWKQLFMHSLIYVLFRRLLEWLYYYCYWKYRIKTNIASN